MKHSKGGPAPLRLVYIAGLGHSGSTLLSRLLSSHPEVLSIGSLARAQEALEGATRACSCGEDAAHCPLWSEVIQRTREEVARSGEEIGPALTSLGMGFRTTRMLLEHLHETSGGKVLCELTHRIERPWMYARLLDCQLVVVHLVRDPRAVAYSRQHREPRPPLAKLMKDDLRVNLSCLRGRWHARSNPRVRYLRVHYEDLCEDPLGIVNAILQAAQLGPVELSALATPCTSHIIGGNEMRLRPISEIAVDQRYARETQRAWWIAATLLSVPLLLWFRYPLSRRGALARWSSVRMEKSTSSSRQNLVRAGADGRTPRAQ